MEYHQQFLRKMQITIKSGEKITGREFMRRWKKGIEGITPLQQASTIIRGTFIVLIGIIWGIVFAIIFSMWWLGVILLGSLIITCAQLLGQYQKYWQLKKIDDMIKSTMEVKNA